METYWLEGRLDMAQANDSMVCKFVPRKKKKKDKKTTQKSSLSVQSSEFTKSEISLDMAKDSLVGGAADVKLTDDSKKAAIAPNSVNNHVTPTRRFDLPVPSYDIADNEQANQRNIEKDGSNETTEGKQENSNGTDKSRANTASAGQGVSTAVTIVEESLNTSNKTNNGQPVLIKIDEDQVLPNYVPEIQSPANVFPSTTPVNTAPSAKQEVNSKLPPEVSALPVITVSVDTD